MESRTKLTICIVSLFMVLLFVTVYSFSDLSARGIKRSGSITGIFTDYEIDDGCGDVLWCYTEIMVNGTWHYFGSPCNYLKYLPFNETYTFFYTPFRNMDCSGNMFWDIEISKIIDSDNKLMWRI